MGLWDVLGFPHPKGIDSGIPCPASAPWAAELSRVIFTTILPSHAWAFIQASEVRPNAGAIPQAGVASSLTSQLPTSREGGAGACPITGFWGCPQVLPLL